jgi:hypothetical protein
MTVDQRPQDGVPDIVLLSNTLVQDGDGSIGCVWATSTNAVRLSGIPRYLQVNVDLGLYTIGKLTIPYKA